MKKGKLNTAQMLKELPIGIDQLRVYLNDGRLPSKKVRNKFELYPFMNSIFQKFLKTELMQKIGLIQFSKR